MSLDILLAINCSKTDLATDLPMKFARYDHIEKKMCQKVIVRISSLTEIILSLLENILIVCRVLVTIQKFLYFNGQRWKT